MYTYIIIHVYMYVGYTVCQAAGDGPIIAGLNNCKTLIPNALNMRWTLKDDTIDMLLEGVVGPEDGYVSFGFSRPGSFVGRMVGGSVVVGMLNILVFMHGSVCMYMYASVCIPLRTQTHISNYASIYRWNYRRSMLW